MTASGDPAVAIKLEISGLVEVVKSVESLLACPAAFICCCIEMVDIAESIEEVRGFWPNLGRRSEGVSCGEAVECGDGGDEWPDGVKSGRGDEIFRSWL